MQAPGSQSSRLQRRIGRISATAPWTQSLQPHTLSSWLSQLNLALARCCSCPCCPGPAVRRAPLRPRPPAAAHPAPTGAPSSRAAGRRRTGAARSRRPPPCGLGDRSRKRAPTARAGRGRQGAKGSPSPVPAAEERGPPAAPWREMEDKMNVARLRAHCAAQQAQRERPSLGGAASAAWASSSENIRSL